MLLERQAIAKAEEFFKLQQKNKNLLDKLKFVHHLDFDVMELIIKTTNEDLVTCTQKAEVWTWYWDQAGEKASERNERILKQKCAKLAKELTTARKDMLKLSAEIRERDLHDRERLIHPEYPEVQ